MNKLIRNGLFAFSCSLGISVLNPAGADEIADRNQLNEQVRNLYLQKNFSSLNSIYLDALNKKTKTASGTMLLWHYYQAFNKYYEILFADQTQDWKNAQQGLDLWERQYPQSAAPKILRARLLSAKAKAYGNSKFLNPSKASCDTKLPVLDQIQLKIFSSIPSSADANTAEFTGISCYFAYNDLLKEYMQKINSTVQNDPEWFTTQLDEFKSDSDTSKCLNAFNEGVKKHPGYYNIYFHAVTCRVSEDRQKRMQMREYIARLAATNTKATDGDALYSRVYWVINSYCCKKNLRKETMVDWSRMQKSINQVVKKYPTQWNYANFAAIACRAGDQQLTNKLFLSIPQYNHSDWDNAETYDYCKSFAKGS